MILGWADLTAATDLPKTVFELWRWRIGRLAVDGLVIARTITILPCPAVNSSDVALKSLLMPSDWLVSVSSSQTRLTFRLLIVST